MLRKSFLMAVVGGVALVSQSVSAAPIVTNGDFESTPYPTNGTYGVNSTAIPGWTVVNGQVEVYDATAFGFPTRNPQLNPTPWTGSGGVQQTLTTIAGQEYKIDIDFGARNESPATTAKAILTFGTQTFNLVSSVSNVHPGEFDHFTFTSTALSSSTLLSIVAAPYDNGNHEGNPGLTTTWKGIIDNVAVVTVPEPATIALAGIGAVGLLSRRRRIA